MVRCWKDDQTYVTANISMLRRVLSEAISGFVVGITNPNGILLELEELEINDNGSLTCYLRSEDDYYYVSDIIRRDHEPDSPSWITTILLKSRSGSYTRFEDFVVRSNA